MSTHDDDPYGDLLARAMRVEAESIVPAGDGLTKIRDRVARRRSRFRWLVPSASVVTAAALAGVAFGAYSMSSNNDSLRSGKPAGGSGSTTGSPTASVLPSTSPSGQPAPGSTTQTGTTSITPVWPFNSATEADQWARDGASSGHSPWHSDAGVTATMFVQNALGFASSQNIVVVKDTTPGRRTGYVSLGTTTTASGRTVIFATVNLVRWGNGPNAPWEIVSVDAPGARIDSPSSDGAISSPVTVRYTLDGGIEDDVTVSVHDGQSQLATTKSSVGGGQHTATVSFGNAATSNGYVVVADVQASSGTSTLQRLVVTPVRFAPPSVSAGGSSTPAQKYPTYFVAVKDSRLAVFYARGGGFARWLTPAQSGGVTLPQLSADHKWVYYLRPAADADAIWRVSINGGAQQQVQSAPSGATIATFAIGGASDNLLAWTTSSNGAQDLRWTGARGSGSFHIPAMPPSVEQLAWAPDGRHLAATVRQGNGWGVQVYDTASAKSVNDGVAVPCAAGSNCSAPSYDAAGNLYVVEASGAQTWQLVQWTGSKVNHVSTWTLTTQANPENGTVDITPDAEAAIVGTPSGEIYRIEHGAATLLPTQATTPTW